MSTTTDRSSTLVPTQRTAEVTPQVSPQSTTRTEPDLSGFLMGHRIFRAEFGRLAVAAAKGPDPKVHYDVREAIEEQIALMVRFLHHHHTAEDERVWPRLRERDPSAAAVLDRLESEHAAIDPLVSVITDRTIPLPDRAPQLQELSDLLNAHLDGEEAEAVPLIRSLIPAEEWDADAEEILAGIKKDMPMIMGTASSLISEDEVAAFLDDVPRIVRILWRLVWRRQWAKRNRLVHGG